MGSKTKRPAKPSWHWPWSLGWWPGLSLYHAPPDERSDRVGAPDRPAHPAGSLTVGHWAFDSCRRSHSVPASRQTRPGPWSLIPTCWPLCEPARQAATGRPVTPLWDSREPAPADEGPGSRLTSWRHADARQTSCCRPRYCCHDRARVAESCCLPVRDGFHVKSWARSARPRVHTANQTLCKPGTTHYAIPNLWLSSAARQRSNLPRP